MPVSTPAASGGIDAECPMSSTDVDLPSTSVSLDAPGERLLQIGSVLCGPTQWFCFLPYMPAVWFCCGEREVLVELVEVAFSESSRPASLLVLLEVLGELIELWPFGIGGISSIELGRAKRGESGGGRVV